MPTAPQRLAALPLALVAVIALLLAGCGGTQATGEDPDVGNVAPDDQGAGEGVGDDALVVELDDFEIRAPLTGRQGAKVTVRNVGNAPHTWTADDGEWDTGTVSPGSQTEVALDVDPGTYEFHCEIHPDRMSGTIEVTD